MAKLHRVHRWTLCLGSMAFLLGGTPGFGQDFDQAKLVDEILKTAPAREAFLDGIGFTATRIHYRNGEEQRRTVTRYDQLGADTWRNDVESKGKKAVIAQNKDLAFDANNSKGEFNYAKVSEPGKPRPSSHDNVGGLSLAKFINDPALKLTPLSDLPPQAGHNVEGVRFSKVQGPMETAGFLHWLPDENHLLARVFVETVIREDNGSEPQRYLVRDDTMEYAVDSERLRLVRKVTNYGNDRKMVMEVSNFTKANPDVAYYSPEAIGLESPKKTNVTLWLAILCVGVVCLVVWFSTRKSHA